MRSHLDNSHISATLSSVGSHKQKLSSRINTAAHAAMMDIGSLIAPIQMREQKLHTQAAILYGPIFIAYTGFFYWSLGKRVVSSYLS